MIVRRTSRFAGLRFGDDPAAQQEDVSLRVSDSTALRGVGLWVLGSVLAHIAIRWVDSTFYKGR